LCFFSIAAGIEPNFVCQQLLYFGVLSCHRPKKNVLEPVTTKCSKNVYPKLVHYRLYF